MLKGKVGDNVQNKNVKHLETIREIVGMEKFQALVTELPGAAVRIPSDADCFDKDERNKMLIEDYRVHKMTVPELAEKYNLSKSRIYKITEKI